LVYKPYKVLHINNLHYQIFHITVPIYIHQVKQECIQHWLGTLLLLYTSILYHIQSIHKFFLNHILGNLCHINELFQLHIILLIHLLLILLYIKYSLILIVLYKEQIYIISNHVFNLNKQHKQVLMQNCPKIHLWDIYKLVQVYIMRMLYQVRNLLDIIHIFRPTLIKFNPKSQHTNCRLSHRKIMYIRHFLNDL